MTNKSERAAVRVTPAVRKQLDVLMVDYGSLTAVFTAGAERLYRDKQRETIKLTIEWLDNLEDDIGLKRLLDNMPNNFGGRIELKELV
jgi:hypothetical protein